MPRTSSHHHHARGRAQAVTSARRSQDEDRGRRMKHYLLAMGIRTACFPLAVWAFATERFALAWVAALAAVLIPSFAVMLANAVDRRQAPVVDEVISPRQGLGPAQQPTPPRPSEPTIQGTVVSSRDTPGTPPGESPSSEDDAP